MITYDTVEMQIKLLVAEYVGLPGSSIDGHKHVVDDYGADSLDTIELIMAIEEEYKISIDDQVAETRLGTVQSIIDYTCELLGVKVEHTNSSYVELSPVSQAFSFRNEVIARIGMIVRGDEGFADDNGRWLPVKELLYDGDAKNKKRAILAVKLSKLDEISDRKLLDVFELVARRSAIQR